MKLKKPLKLDPEEQEIEDAFERGEFLPVKNQEKMKKMFMEAAKNTLAKNKNINIRLTERVLTKLRAKAAELGIPYQTLASSILHRYVNS